MGFSCSLNGIDCNQKLTIIYNTDTIVGWGKDKFLHASECIAMFTCNG